MPLIRIEFDEAILGDDDIVLLSSAIQKIVAEETLIEKVFVYANSSRIRISIPPIEIFVEMSASKIKDLEDLAGRIRKRLGNWKEKNKFAFPINLKIIPMNWKTESDI